ncbi:MAG: hypothetical protein D3904_10405, partial [Candidatus Electrothrix sp. EH2]|nr:hypothetical protein [Candidatus Electrothrix sp. EH2]
HKGIAFLPLGDHRASQGDSSSLSVMEHAPLGENASEQGNEKDYLFSEVPYLSHQLVGLDRQPAIVEA